MIWKTLSSEYIHKDDWLTARKDVCQRPDGKIIEPYYVLEYSDWAVAVPVTDDGRVVLTRQYRHALGEISIEFPGGCIDAEDATPEDAVRRELLEESGYAFESVHYLGRTSANPSTNSNLMHLFVATDGKKIQEQTLDMNEDIEVFTVTFEELYTLLLEKRIVQSMHMAAAFYALHYLGKLRLG
jgi:ADP-ribose pyrophosphatase